MNVYGCPKYRCGAHTLGTRVATVSETRRLLWRRHRANPRRNNVLRVDGCSPNLWPSTVIEVVTPAAASIDAVIRDPDATSRARCAGSTGCAV